MPTEKDSFENGLPGGMQLYPNVDVEDAVMASVHKLAEARKQAYRLRRRGLVCLSVFLLLALLALFFSRAGAAHSSYVSSLTNYGFVLLFLGMLFVQLEAWWRKREAF